MVFGSAGLFCYRVNKSIGPYLDLEKILMMFDEDLRSLIYWDRHIDKFESIDCTRAHRRCNCICCMAC